MEYVLIVLALCVMGVGFWITAYNIAEYIADKVEVRLRKVLEEFFPEEDDDDDEAT